MIIFENLIEAISYYKSLGYIEDFNIEQNYLACSNATFKILPNEFKVDNFYRFDAMTNPEDESIIYAISSEKYNIKGILINGYGASSERTTNDLLLKLL